MDCGRDVDQAAAGAGGGGDNAVGEVGVGGGGLEEVGEAGFGGVEGAEHVDVDYGFEGVGGEMGEWGEEVAGCSGSGRGGFG